MTTVFPNVACPRCACVCDDLQLTVQGERIVTAERACHLAEDWFLQQNSRTPPIAMHHGQPCDRPAAVQAAIDLLRNARYPLIYGLSRSSTAGQRAAVALADHLGATIDTTASEGHAPSLLALQQTGESTASLGEIRHRADLVIFWGADPETTHPRHLERYSLFPKGEQIPNGRADRTLVVIDHDLQQNRTAALADVRLELPAGSDFAALWTLRLLLQGQTVAATASTEATATGSAAELPLDDLRQLAERMRSCRTGVIFFGYGLARQPLGHRVVEALLQLVIDLNLQTRFYARRLRMLGDVAGADNVLCWQTGYPFAVNFAAGYPRFSPGEFSAADVLSRGEADVALFVGCDRVDEFPATASRQLDQIPTILLDGALAEPAWSPTLRFTTATYGVHTRGTAYRMDDIPIPLQAVLPTPYPTDAEILTDILTGLSTDA